ncbi:hypothetical protein [Jidongwangia harbinensis]|uniref:hypothetical protein n=1 Tax=Jidongwangia harbinensis TaxID=2878561 RepID=UPI001CDA09BD|nr:hypothetical protein [Jidongwangia harbinensis]MCA2216782.1 hypothetical protein [Jidongwangia harbinensis]
MEIDPRIEEHVREAYRGIIGRDGDRMVAAFHGLGADDAAKAVAYGVFVLGYIVNDVFRNGATDADLRQLAGKIIESESDWINLRGADDVAGVLRSAATGEVTFPGVPPADVIGHVFVAGGYLLGVYRRADQEWWDYLDEIWAVLLTLPPQQ